MSVINFPVRHTFKIEISKLERPDIEYMIEILAFEYLDQLCEDDQIKVNEIIEKCSVLVR